MIVLRESDTAYVAARAMKDHNVGCVLVIDDEGRLSGIATDRDLVMRCVCDNRDARDTDLRLVMSKDPYVVGEHQADDPERLLWVMSGYGVRRLPIVGADGRPIGVLTLDDLVASGHVRSFALFRNTIAQQLKQPARLMRREEGEGGERKKEESFVGSSGLYSISPEEMRLMLEDGEPEESSAHAEQTWGRYLSLVTTCLESRNIFAMDRECVELATRVFLRLLVRRLDATSATKFIAQLPMMVREELLSERAGPDRSITPEFAARAVRAALRLNSEQGVDAVSALAEALALSISPGEVRILSRRLPPELGSLLAASA